jgi:transposase
MTTVIGIDPHKASHTAVAIDNDEHPLAQLQVPADRSQTQRLLAWAEPLGEDRCGAIEAAGGLGRLLAQQLLAQGQHVIDVPPTLAARVRLLGTSKAGKSDPNDALAQAEEVTPQALRLLRDRLRTRQAATPRLGCQFRKRPRVGRRRARLRARRRHPRSRLRDLPPHGGGNRTHDRRRRRRTAPPHRHTAGPLRLAPMVAYCQSVDRPSRPSWLTNSVARA